MSEMYCEYSGVKYKIKKRNGEYLITSRVRNEGFTNYVDVLGNTHSELFMKIVDATDVDIIFEEGVSLRYRGVFFQLFADKVTNTEVLNDSYMIWTNSEKLAQEFLFEKKEQFVFTKYITRKEIEAIKIVRKPVLEFKNIEQSDKILEGDALDNWLSQFK